LAAQGVVVFTVGVGTPAGGPVPVPREGAGVDWQRDSSGQLVQSRLSEDTLRAIAEATHGAYQPLGTLGEGMNRIRLALDSPSFFPDLAQTRKLGVDRFHLPVAAVILLLTIESLVGTRRKVRETEPDRV
jgi:Ca-activated chloride channel homolog